MDLDPYVDTIHRQLEISAEPAGKEAQAIVQRLAAPLDAAIKLSLLEALSAAAEEITVELAPGSVELRLRSGSPDFVVTPPPSEEGSVGDDADDGASQPLPLATDDDGSISRINLRLPEHLKARVERSAANDGMSINAWLVRAAASAVERGGHGGRRERRASNSKQRYTGWAR
jgi:HicB-like protein involved in pilus formation